MLFKRKSFGICYKNARQMLKRTGIAFLLLVVSLLSFFALLGLCLTFRHLFSALPMSAAAAYAMAILCSAFGVFMLIIPLSFGVDAMLLEYLKSGRMDVSIVFSFFTCGSRFCSAVTYALASFLRLAVFGITLWAMLYFGSRVARALLSAADAVRGAMVLFTTILFALLLLIFYAFSSADRFLLRAVMVNSPLLTYRQSSVISRFRMRYSRNVAFRFYAYYCFLFLMSLLLFGLPLVFIIPYMRASRCQLAAELLKS